MPNNTWDIVGAEFVTSAVKATQYPQDTLDEVAFIGRSNVGKSSLLNSLARRKNLARVSASPGKTQTINFYQFRAKKKGEDGTQQHIFYAVDLPGYGFARTNQQNKEQWSAFICSYMENSPYLKQVYLLMDCRREPMESDRECYQWLISLGLSVVVILTKTDKLSKNALAKQKSLYQRTFEFGAGQILTYSAMSHETRKDLIQRIMEGLDA